MLLAFPQAIARLLFKLFAATAMLAACAAAQAMPVTYLYAGQVDSDDADRGWISFSGSLTFDSGSIDAIADMSTAAYAASGAPFGMSVLFDDGTSDSLSDSVNLLVSNNLGGWDWLGALAQNAAGTKSLGLSLIDFSAALFASDALPLPPGGLTLADFGYAQFSYESGGGMLQGHLDSFACVEGCSTVPSVPEPETWLLMFAGLLAMGVQARRRSR